MKLLSVFDYTAAWCDCRMIDKSASVIVHMKYSHIEVFLYVHDEYRLVYNGRFWENDISDNKKLSYHRGTARCVVSIEILPIATQQCRNYLYDKS